MQNIQRKEKQIQEPIEKAKKANPISKSLPNWQSFGNFEKARKIVGLLIVLIGLISIAACIAYLFTWKFDQSLLFNNTDNFLFNADIQVDNWLGRFGAWLSHNLIYNGFGLPTIILCIALIGIGFKAILPEIKLKLRSRLPHAVLITAALSITFGFVFTILFDTKLDIMGGAFGLHIGKLISDFIGNLGLILTLLLFWPAYFIFTFNLKLSLPQKEPQNTEIPLDQNPQATATFPSATNQAAKKVHVLQEEPALEKEELLPETIDLPISTTETADLSNHQKAVTANKNPKSGKTITFEIEEEDTEHIIQNDLPNSYGLNLEIETAQDEDIIDGDVPIVATIEGKIGPEMPVAHNADKDAMLTAEDLVKKYGPYDPRKDLPSYQFPALELLGELPSKRFQIDPEELEKNKDQIIATLGNYAIEIEKIKATVGPTVTLYEIVPAPGVRISKIKNLEDDIALSLAALGIRIIAPIPGKGTIGIEVPNLKPETVSIRTVLGSEKFVNAKMELPVAIGKTISNEVFVADLTKMPHMLMAGATGQGKSVGLNTLLVSLLYRKHPAELKLVLVDPKKVELSLFKHIERHFLAKLPGEEEAIITDTSKVVATLNSLCVEMDVRYDLLKDAQVRNILEYNAKFVNRRLNPNEGHRYLPYIVVVVDEFADLIMTAGKEVETPIARLAQLARAVGIHLIIATQRPSVNIITGTIKANFPVRIAFKVSSKVDSRTILDTGGAEQLIGRGDMLVNLGSEVVRLQCAFVDTPEVEQVCEFIGTQRGYPDAFLLPEFEGEMEGNSAKDFDLSERDPLFEEAARTIVLHQQGSTSLLQRKLKLGYNRAGRLMDQLEATGVVGPFEGSKARSVLIPDDYALEQFLKNLNEK